MPLGTARAGSWWGAQNPLPPAHYCRVWVTAVPCSGHGGDLGNLFPLPLPPSFPPSRSLTSCLPLHPLLSLNSERLSVLDSVQALGVPPTCRGRLEVSLVLTVLSPGQKKFLHLEEPRAGLCLTEIAVLSLQPRYRAFS